MANENFWKLSYGKKEDWDYSEGDTDMKYAYMEWTPTEENEDLMTEEYRAYQESRPTRFGWQEQLRADIGDDHYVYLIRHKWDGEFLIFYKLKPSKPITTYPLRIKRPVMAPRTRNRPIGQEVFKEIVKMAYEMEKAEKIANEMLERDNSLRDLIARSEAFHVQSCLKIPRGPHTVLATGKLRGYKNIADVMMDSVTFTMKGVKCLHRLIVQKRRWTHSSLRGIVETGDIILQDMMWNQDETRFICGDNVTSTSYSINTDFLPALYSAYEDYAHYINTWAFHRLTNHR